MGPGALEATAKGQWSSGARSLNSTCCCTLAEGLSSWEAGDTLGWWSVDAAAPTVVRGRCFQKAEVSPVFRPAHAPGPAF